MAQTYALDRVIQKVSAGASTETDAQEIVTIDVKKKSAVPRSRLTLRDCRYYRVSNDTDPRNEAKLEIPHLQVPDLEHQVAVSMTVQLSCPKGHEEQVAEALFDVASSPTDVLERHLTRTIVEASRDGLVAFVQRYIDDRTALQQLIATALLRRTGLQAKVKVVFDAEHSFHVIRVERNHHAVLVSDYDVEQDLKLRVDLEVDDGKRAAALLHFPKNCDLQDIVTQEIKRFIRRHVSMQDFCTELAGGRLNELLSAYLNQALAGAGRRVAALVLQPNVPTDLQLSLQTQMDVTCEVQEFPRPIVINNKLLMLLKNFGRFKASNVVNLSGWLRDRLEHLIPEVLFDAKYIDLLIRFKPFEERIKQTLSEDAFAIGYEIKQLITVPDLAPLRLRDPFSIDAADTFATKLPNFSVKLQVIVRARIPNLQTVESYLNRQDDIPELMRQVILEQARQYLHQIDPQRFYMRFSFTDPVHYPKEVRSVEAELTALIRKRLIRAEEPGDFCADVVSIVIKVVETDLIERLRRLQERICSFEVTVPPLRGGPSINFFGDFNVRAVDAEGWDAFQHSAGALDDIRQHLEAHLLGRLQALSGEALLYREEQGRALIEERIATYAKDYVKQQYGLSIDITNVRREQTGVERLASAHLVSRLEARLALNKAQIDDWVTTEVGVNRAVLNEIAVLLEHRRELVAVEGSEGEISAIDQKIKALRETLGQEKIPSIDELEATVLQGQMALEGLREALALPAFTGQDAPAPIEGARRADEEPQ